jgi:hypothetical protein
MEESYVAVVESRARRCGGRAAASVWWKSGRVGVVEERSRRCGGRAVASVWWKSGRVGVVEERRFSAALMLGNRGL